MAKIVIDRAAASSTYREPEFGTQNLYDGLGEVDGWLSNVAEWQDAWVRFNFAEPASVTGVVIWNGFIEASKAGIRDDYYFHLRAQDIEIYFGDDSEPTRLTLSDSKEPQTHALTTGGPVEKVQVVVKSAYSQSPDPAIKPFDVVGFRQFDWLQE